MRKFLIAGLAVAAFALIAQPSLANPPQKQQAPQAHPAARAPIARPAAHAPAFRPQPTMGSQRSAFGGPHPVNNFQANRPGFGQQRPGFAQQRPGFAPVNHPGQFNPGDRRGADPRFAHQEQLRRDEQIRREQQVRHEEIRDEHRDERRDARIRAQQQGQGGGGDQSAPADQSADDSSGAPADSSSGNKVLDSINSVKSVLDQLQGKGQGQ